VSDVAITFELNGRTTPLRIQPQLRLIDVLRDSLGLTGTKEGCSEGECGACTVLVDGRTVNSCLFPAIEADGCKVTTVEGLVGPGGCLSTVQEAFLEGGGVQCGFCTPGMIMTAAEFLEEHADPTEAEIREALTGNLCRCTGYVQIVDSIQRAAHRHRSDNRQQGAET
jgi:carbon-monoxide dehydrogenase small subunit